MALPPDWKLTMSTTALTTNILDTPAGGTAPVRGEAPLPAFGYFVGGVVSALIVEPSELASDEARSMIDLFVNYLRTLRAAPYVGWWTDEETGKLYVDATEHHWTYEAAEAACRDRNEIAFYCIELGRSFRPVELPV